MNGNQSSCCNSNFQGLPTIAMPVSTIEPNRKFEQVDSIPECDIEIKTEQMPVSTIEPNRKFEQVDSIPECDIEIKTEQMPVSTIEPNRKFEQVDSIPECDIEIKTEQDSGEEMKKEPEQCDEVETKFFINEEVIDIKPEEESRSCLDFSVKESEVKRDKTMWTKDLIKRFIELLKPRECLWRVSSVHYHNKKIRQTALNEIGSELKIHPEEVKQKFNRLRLQFAHEKNRMNSTKSEIGSNMYVTRWEFFDSLKDIFEQSNVKTFAKRINTAILPERQEHERTENSHLGELENTTTSTEQSLVLTIKQENTEEDEGNENAVAESGIMSCLSDRMSPHDENVGAKQNGALYNAVPQLSDIEPSGMPGDKTTSAEWTCGLELTSNNFLYEKSEGLFHARNLIIRPEDVDTLVVVVDPHSMDVDSMSDDDYSERGMNGKGMGGSQKKSCLKMVNRVNNIKRAKKFSLGSKSTAERPFSCAECGKRFAQRAHLARHGLVHTGERPFGCSICGKAFADISTLTTHMRTHTGERPFACDICGKAFTGRSDLRKHAIIHTGRRSYVCNVCSKSFTRSTSLKKHSRIHSGVRPHACRECSKTFAAKGDLTRHSLIHFGCKPFICLICNVAFARRDELTRHEKTHERDPQIHIK